MESTIKTAYIIAANPHDYPMIIRLTAAHIVKCHQQKRQSVKNLWEMREVFRFFISAKKNFRDGNSSKVQRSRKANMEVRLKFGEEVYKKLCSLHSDISANQSDIKYCGWCLTNLIKVLQCNVTEHMLDYIERINTKQELDSQCSLSFIQYVPAAHVSEIMVWRMVNHRLHY